MTSPTTEVLGFLLEIGEVVVADAYDLDAEYVIHAAAMSHSGPHRLATVESIRDATQNALATADDLECPSLVVPLLGCGSGGVHTQEGAPILCDEIRAYEPTALQDVRVIGYTDREIDILEEIVVERE